MTLRILLLAIAILVFGGKSFSQEAQEAQESKEEDSFEPYGKPIIRIYTNYHSTWTGGEVNKVFQIQRAYLGYQRQFSKTISGRLILDVGDPAFGNFQMTAYLKNAFLQYRENKFTARIGMIGLFQFKIQEDMWGGRYFYKSFMDEHRFGPSADLGAFVKYDFHKIVSADITLTNGEGYKKLESDSILKVSLGTTVRPLKGLDLRVSYDYMGNDAPQQTLALYAGYASKGFRVGAEYNYQLNHKMTAGQDLSGVSFYGSYQMKKVRFIGRYDKLSSPQIGSETDPWNYQKDGQLFIAGVEFNPVKGIMVTPHYQGWVRADGAPMSNSAYLSLEIRF